MAVNGGARGPPPAMGARGPRRAGPVAAGAEEGRSQGLPVRARAGRGAAALPDAPPGRAWLPPPAASR